jgi:hypothetical protein
MAVAEDFSVEFVHQSIDLHKKLQYLTRAEALLQVYDVDIFENIGDRQSSRIAKEGAL